MKISLQSTVHCLQQLKKQLGFTVICKRSTVNYSRGFTLVELLVSIAIFSMVMLIAVGALLSMVDANRKAQTVKSIVNNLSFALDGMSRAIRIGSSFHCGATGSVAVTRDCIAGDTYLAFEPFNGNPSTPSDQQVYRLHGTTIERSEDGGATFDPITAPEVVVQTMEFYVVGSLQGDGIQPKIVLTLEGYTGTNDRTRTDIHLQTTLTPRLLDE